MVTRGLLLYFAVAAASAVAHDAGHDAGRAFESLPIRERGQQVIDWLDAGNGVAIYEHCAEDAKRSTYSPCGLGAEGMAAWARQIAAKCGAITSVEPPIVTGEHTQYDLYSCARPTNRRRLLPRRRRASKRRTRRSSSSRSSPAWPSSGSSPSSTSS